MNAFSHLGLSETASPSEVRAAYLRLSKIHHPDQGGDPAAFSELREAYTKALTAAQMLPCGNCGGTGTTVIPRGWTTIKLTCDSCQGTGRAHP